METKRNPVLATCSQGLFWFPVNILKIEQSWNLSSGKTSSQKSTKYIARATATQWYYWILLFSNISDRKCALNQKAHFLLLANNFIYFLFCKAKYQTQLVEQPKFKSHPNTAKAFSSPKYIYQHVEHHKKLISLGVQVDKL